MTDYLTVNRLKKQLYYSVRNSHGDIALITTNRQLAEKIAKAFEQDPSATEVAVLDTAVKNPKRR